MAAGNPGPVVPERYVQALAGRDPIESQKKAPKRVKKLVRGLSEKELAARPAPGKWSIKEIIAHLADGEVILGSRLRFVAAMERPTIIGYDQDAFVDKLGIARVKTAELLDAFAAVRGANVGLMKRLPRETYARVGLHSERGEESIHTMLVMYAGHDHIHEREIERLRDEFVAARPRKDAAKSGGTDKRDKKAAKKAEKALAKHAEKLAKKARSEGKSAKLPKHDAPPKKKAKPETVASP
ncbi:MAG: DinB family protein [Planctomycetota bacterium]